MQAGNGRLSGAQKAGSVSDHEGKSRQHPAVQESKAVYDEDDKEMGATVVTAEEIRNLKHGVGLVL